MSQELQSYQSRVCTISLLKKHFLQLDIYTFMVSSPFELAQKQNKTFDQITSLAQDEGIKITTLNEALLNMWSRKVKTNFVTIRSLQNELTNSYRYQKYREKQFGQEDARPDTIFDLIDDYVYSK